MEDDQWRRGVEALRGEEFGEVYRKWGDLGEVGESEAMVPPRCRGCGRVDAKFEEAWMGVYQGVKGGVLGLEGEVEGVIGELGVGGERKVREVRGEGRVFEVWVRVGEGSGEGV